MSERNSSRNEKKIFFHELNRRIKTQVSCKKKALLEKVDSIAKRVKETGRSYTFEPLQASNRKVVHQYIEKDTSLRTRTIGDGSRKRVVVLPANKPTTEK